MARVVSYGQKILARPLRSELEEDGASGPSPDWFLVHILKDIAARKPRYDKLRLYAEGTPPRPETPDSLKDEWIEYERFRDKSRTNFSSLVTAACMDKTAIQGFRTAAEGDEDGDKEADRLWELNDMAVKSDKAMFDMYTYGRGFLLVEPLTKRAQHYRPWQAGLVRDIVGDPLVGLNIFHNPMEGRDYAYLWMRETDELGMATGTVALHIAVRDRENKVGRGDQFDSEIPLGTYLPRNWHWWKTVELDGSNGTAVITDIPLVEYENRDGVGEFEPHIDILDRINHMLLQRVVIATMQAFRQRAIKGKLPKKDERGNDLDYNKMFPVAPASLWLLGPDAEMWESQTTGVQDILNAVKDDVRDLSSVTRTPMTYFSPDAANGSAEGATLQREAYTSKIEDRKARNSGRWRMFMSLLFQVNGDSERSKIEDIEVLWSPTETLSLTERFSAAVQGSSFGVPLKTLMREVLHWTPKQMRAADLERVSAILQAAVQPAGNGGQQGGSLTPMQQSAQANAQMAKTNGANSKTTGASA